MGGGPQPPELVRGFVELSTPPASTTPDARRPTPAYIVVLAQASAQGQRSGEEKAADLRALGARARSLWFARAAADDDSVVAALDSATGVWFGGGDQNRLADALRGSRALATLERRWRAGEIRVVGGTSAGAAVMSAVMITGDERRPGGARPDTTQAWITIEADNVAIAPGFGLLPGAVVDQHFLRRRRHNRLVSLVLERAPHLGVGIDESTALVVHPDDTWSVEGASDVVVYDAREAVRTTRGRRLAATNVVMHLLPAGAHFDPRRRAATLPAGAP